GVDLVGHGRADRVVVEERLPHLRPRHRRVALVERHVVELLQLRLDGLGPATRDENLGLGHGGASSFSCRAGGLRAPADDFMRTGVWSTTYSFIAGCRSDGPPRPAPARLACSVTRRRPPRSRAPPASSARSGRTPTASARW